MYKLLFLKVGCYQRRINDSGDWRPWTAGAKVAGDALLPLDDKVFKANENYCGKKAGFIFDSTNTQSYMYNCA